MDRLDAMRLFLSSVQRGSLAAAGRQHGHSPAAVTRAIAMLEREAGETLLLRSTRRLSLTAAGERHLAVYAAVADALDELAPEASGPTMLGTVSLTAPELFGRLAVMPMLDSFLSRHPSVRLRVLLQNRLVALVGEGVDLAVRLAPLRDSTLRAVRLGTVRTLTCAAPAYIATAGTPTTPGDLQQHSCIGLNADGDGELWRFTEPTSGTPRHHAVRISPRLGVDHAAAAIEAAERGLGIVRVRSYQVANAIADNRLVRLLGSHEIAPTPVSLLFPPERAARGAVRALIDHLTPELKEFLEVVEREVSGAGGDDD